MSAGRALVVTVVHHPHDARIRHREIAALLAAGWDVTYAAPFSGYDLPLPSVDDGPAVIDLPRAQGRRRMAALRAVRRLLRQRAREFDVVVLHDPELLAALPGLDLPPVVWDVHEDTAAAVSLKPWLPGPLRRTAAGAVRLVERRVERRMPLLLAETAYQDRFSKPHPVVPNTVVVPDHVVEPGATRVVYVGHLSRARGVEVMIDTARLLAARSDGDGVELHLVGHADSSTELSLRAAQEAGLLTWHGFLPSSEALALLDGALAGLSLLRDEPNYRVSMPTKVVEYMAHGVPVITSPLPLAADLVRDSDSGVVVPFDDPAAVAEAVLALRADSAQRVRLGAHGHRVAGEQFDWTRQSQAFVAEIARIAGL